MKRFFEPYRLSLVQRAFLAPYFGFNAILDPTRGDMVAGLGDVTGLAALQNMRDRMRSSEAGRALLRDKPLVSSESLDLPRLESLPEGTLGRGYWAYMSSHGFSADARPNVRFMDDPDIAYVMARYRQIHDFWHVLTGLPPSELGEIAQKAFEWRVTGLPVGLISTLVGPLRLPFSQRRLLLSTYLPWALRAGGECGDLMSFAYEQHFDRPVEEVRKLLRLEAAPPLAWDPRWYNKP